MSQTLNIVDKVDDYVKITNVIVSVFDKTNLEIFIPQLVSFNPNITIYSTGGTYKKIFEILGETKNLAKISQYTGQPEMQGGLVKTLDYKIYLGLLSETYNESHTSDLKRVSGIPIDMVICNLYPFLQTITKDGVTPEVARTNIDIGGPCMIRASAKNFLRVASVCDPKDYHLLLEELKSCNCSLSLKTRFFLSMKAFKHTAEYDGYIRDYFSNLEYSAIVNSYSIYQDLAM
jgi:phosphoribosylaminoimidazolecarboxamide formyltransferase / IMP cyclohydrolase